MLLVESIQAKMAKEDDPDILQILDESDTDWVTLWKAKLKPAKPCSFNEQISIAIPTISLR